jgi:hypothetical protein
MKMLRAIPTWALTNALTVLRILRVDHPRRGRWFTLRKWYQNQTDFCRGIDYLMWTSLICVIIIIYTIQNAFK